jgi:site-specific DNA-methyltransferase (cytosine-N4-specific)
LILSLITIEFSNQESDTRYAAMDKGLVSSSEILKKYILRSEKNLEILANLNYSKNIHKVYLENSKLINEIVTSDVDMIITSPPYPNTYDYYLYHKHRMLWLGYDFKSVMNNEIGSRREFSSLKKPVSNFTNDLFQILCSCDKVLKKNGHVLIIIGDGVVNGTKYNSNIETKKIAKRLGWIIIDEKYTELDKTSKKFQSSFRKKGKKEHYLLFRKV